MRSAMTMDQITAAYPNVAKLEEAAHEEIMCRECCDTSDKWQDEASPEAVLALVGLVKSLAAENVSLSECNADIMKHVYRSKTYLEHSRVVDAIQGLQCAIERKQGNTPATDRFGAEMKAQGVEMLGASAERLMSEFGDDSYKVMVTADLQRFASAFAKQLREVGQ